MARMRIYTAHIDPSRKDPYETPVFIEEGMNFYAFVFHLFWAFYHRLWLVAVCIIGVNMLITVAAEMLDLNRFSVLVMQMGLQIFIGLQGNEYRRTKLRKQGYLMTDIVTGDNPVGAEQRYFERYFPKGHLAHAPGGAIPMPS